MHLLLHFFQVDFVWVNRDQKSFEWFIHVLKDLESEQSLTSSDQNKLVNIHLYMTSVLKRSHMDGIGLQLALDLKHRNERKDFFTGLETRTQPGRPDWDQVRIHIKWTLVSSDTL